MRPTPMKVKVRRTAQKGADGVVSRRTTRATQTRRAGEGRESETGAAGENGAARPERASPAARASTRGRAELRAATGAYAASTVATSGAEGRGTVERPASTARAEAASAAKP